MADEVIRVSTVSTVDNPAAMENKIADLIAAHYSGPDWVKMGPNFVRNLASGEVVNVNQEAVSILQAEGPRKDAIAIVATPEGEKKIWIEQTAVKAAGGNMAVLKANLQGALNESDAAGVPFWVWIAGAAGVGFLLLRSRGGGGRR